MRIVDHAGVLQDQDVRANVNFRFTRNIFFRANARREMERWEGVDFHKTRFSINNGINSSRRVSLFYSINWGDQIRFIDNPYLGRSFEYDINVTLRPTSRLNTQLRLDASRLTNTVTDQPAFDVKILRAFTTYQFTDRLLIRNILERDTSDGKVGINVLLTYRVNSGRSSLPGSTTGCKRDHPQQGRVLHA